MRVMLPAWVTILFFLMLGSVSCGAFQVTRPSGEDKVSLELVAPRIIHFSGQDSRKLPVTVRISNGWTQPINLRALTPCAVFRWSVMNAQEEIVQSQPQRPCAQVLALVTLDPAQHYRRTYEILLDPHAYITGGGYRLTYTFWGYSGYHDFMVHSS